MFNKVILSNQTMVCKQRILPGGNCILKVNNKSTNKNKVRNMFKVKNNFKCPPQTKNKKQTKKSNHYVIY